MIPRSSSLDRWPRPRGAACSAGGVSGELAWVNGHGPDCIDLTPLGSHNHASLPDRGHMAGLGRIKPSALRKTTSTSKCTDDPCIQRRLPARWTGRLLVSAVWQQRGYLNGRCRRCRLCCGTLIAAVGHGRSHFMVALPWEIQQ